MGDGTVKRGRHGKAGKNPRLCVSLSRDLNAQIAEAAAKFGQNPTAWVRDRLIGIPVGPMPESFVFPQIAAALGQLKALRRELDSRWQTLMQHPEVNQQRLASWVTTIDIKLEALRIALTPPDDNPKRGRDEHPSP